MKKEGLIISLAVFTTVFLVACKEKHKPTRTPVSKNWIGEWDRNEWQNNAGLSIKKINSDSIAFDLSAANGGNTGELEGMAVVDSNKATFYSVDGNDTCRIEFTLLGDTVIAIDQVCGMCSAGMGVVYSGKYYRSKDNADNPETDNVKKESLLSIGLLSSPADDSMMKLLTGKDYDLFVNSTQLTSEDSDLDGLNAKVYASGVRGLFTIMENIIMINADKNIWAAVIDSDKVLYYTNRKDWAGRLPKTINNWRENFKDDTVVYKSGK